MFQTVAPTSWDLHFRLFGIPVRVHPMFWLIALILGPTRDTRLLLVWIPCIFVSILLHELGHALAARWFGYRPHIVLHGGGGYASYQPTSQPSMPRSVAIALAGPCAGFLIYGLLLLLVPALQSVAVTWSAPARLFYHYALVQLVWINLWWGLVNLLPILPLDGGRICEAIARHFSPYRGVLIAYRISLALAVIVCVYFFQQQQIWPAMLFGMIAFENWQALARQP